MVTGTASGFEKQTTGGFNDAADKYKFLAIYLKDFILIALRTILAHSFPQMISQAQTKHKYEICAIDADIYPQYPNLLKVDVVWASCSDDLGFIKK